MHTEYFAALAAHLAAQGVPDMGTAAAQVGDCWLVVDYNCDGRLTYHATVGAGGEYANTAQLVHLEQQPNLQAPGLLGVPQALLQCRWVALD